LIDLFSKNREQHLDHGATVWRLVVGVVVRDGICGELLDRQLGRRTVSAVGRSGVGRGVDGLEGSDRDLFWRSGILELSE